MFYDFITKYTGIFVEKTREAFAVQKLLSFFQQKYLQISDINIINFNENLTNNDVSFEKPGPGLKVNGYNLTGSNPSIYFLSPSSSGANFFLKEMKILSWKNFCQSGQQTGVQNVVPLCKTVHLHSFINIDQHLKD